MWPTRKRHAVQASAQLAVLRDELTAATTLASDLPTLQEVVADHFRQIAGSAVVLLCAYDAESNSYVSVATSPAQAKLATKVTVAATGNLIQWLEVNEAYLLIPDDMGVFDHLASDEQETLRRLHVRLVLPLLVAGHAVGLLLFVDGSPHWRAPREELAMWLQCAQQVASTCEAAGRRRLEHERLKTRHQAQQLVVAGQLAATVAHEVRNPLSTIRSTIQYVMSSHAAWDSKCELLHDALAEIDRIEQSVAGMLSLSRPRDLVLTETDITVVARDSVRLVQAYADAQGVAIQAALVSPMAVIADVKELRQVFVNLLLNACQAMVTGGALVVSSAMADSPDSAAPSPRRFAVIHIADNGPGIPEAQREQVFDPFFTTKTSGTGLGLPICLEIVSRHGGRLTLACPATGGTIASVWLPVKGS